MTVPQSPAHRSEIDLLRTIAILGVLLYHLQIRPFTGGFVGVDVFLVISGFLITQILEASPVSFASLRSFYGKRIRRLYPALVVTIAVTLLASYLLFLPRELLQSARSAAFALFSLSNLLFLHESGYFDAASHSKPLLHTWSLGVECQFYLLWPFVVRLDRAMRKRLPAGSVLALVGLLSFALSLHLGPDDPAAFFLVFPRLWEFCAGGLLAVRLRGDAEADASRHRTLACAAGLFVIGACMVLYGPRTPFPGWSAMAPVAGAALCIYGGSSNGIVARLSGRALRTLADLSYTLYLVHWPLIVLTGSALHGRTTSLGKIGLLAATFALSAVLHRFVEQPFLRPAAAVAARRTLGLALPAVMVATLAGAIGLWATEGLPAYRIRGLDELRRVAAYDYQGAQAYVWSRAERFERAGGFRTARRRILLVGDSQAADVLNVLIERGLDRSAEIIYRRVNSTCGLPYLPPQLPAAQWWTDNPDTARAPRVRDKCQASMQEIDGGQALQQADVVLVAFHWRPLALPYITPALRALIGDRPDRLWVFGSKTVNAAIPDILAQAGTLAAAPAFALAHLPAETTGVNRQLERDFGPHFIDILGLLCNPRTGCALVDDRAGPVLSDTLHLTPEGARYVAARLSALPPMQAALFSTP